MIPQSILDYFIHIILCGCLGSGNFFRHAEGKNFELFCHTGKCKGRKDVNDYKCSDPLIAKCEHTCLSFTPAMFIEYVYFNGINLSSSVFKSIGFNKCVLDILRGLMRVKVQFAKEYGLHTDTWERKIIENCTKEPKSRCLSFITHDSMHDCIVCLRKRTEIEKFDLYTPCTCAEINAPDANGIFTNNILYVLPLVICLDCIFNGIWYSVNECFKICFHDSRYFYLMILVKINGVRNNTVIKVRYKCLDTNRHTKRFYKSYTVKDSDTYMYFLRQCQSIIFDPLKAHKFVWFAHVLKTTMFPFDLQNDSSSDTSKGAFTKHANEMFILHNLPYAHALVKKYIRDE